MEELLYSLHDRMQKIGVEYAVCGGHATDLFLGRRTRPHKDLDVAVLWEDRDRIVRDMLQLGWRVFEPYGGGISIGSAALRIREKSRITSGAWPLKMSIINSAGAARIYLPSARTMQSR